jgi:hypothetical protein
MNKPVVGKKKKKPYIKPSITRVELVAEEAVLGGCKEFGFCDIQFPPLVSGGT